MKHPTLTRSSLLATFDTSMKQRRSLRARRLVVLGAAMTAAGLSGCISVNAPDKPIVIELNINVKQEVVYRLAADANNTIEANPGIF